MTISKKAAKRIARLINSAHVAAHMAHNAVHRDRDTAAAIMWMRAEAEAVVSLADEFGIELPTLESARKRVAEVK